MASFKDNISSERLLRGAQLASWVVVGGYGVALAYRFGFLQRIFPKSIAASLECAVEKVKSWTEPVGDSVRYAVVRRHLTQVYSIASVGMLAGALGGALFFSFPKVPIAIPVSLTVAPAALLLLLPREVMFPACRVACFLTSSFAVGCSFAPIGWVAWDSLSILMMLTASTMSGLCIPLFLTRGMASYVLSSQLLSCAATIIALTTTPPLLTSTGLNNGGATEVVRVLQRTDVNVLLVMQLMMNWGINLLHTLPTIARFVKWRGLEDELLLTVDPVKEALCICSGGAYVFWRCSQWACRRLVEGTLGAGVGGEAERRGHHATSLYDQLKSTMRSRRVVDAGATVMLVLCYVRAVSKLQKGETVKALETLRVCCARVSPINLVLTRV